MGANIERERCRRMVGKSDDGRVVTRILTAGRSKCYYKNGKEEKTGCRAEARQ